MEPQIRPSDRAGILGTIDPQSATTVQGSSWVDATTFHNIMGIVQVGSITASGTVDAKFQQATDSSGTGAKNIASPPALNAKAITQLTQAGSGSSKQVVINLRQEDLDIAGGFKFVKLTITPATAAAVIAGLVLGFDPRNLGAGSNAATSQTQVL